MNLLQAAILGVVQGLTEFLPISSTAHVYLVPRLVGVDDPGAAFTAVIQLGTLAAVLIYFSRELWMMSRSMVGGLVERSRWQEFDTRLAVLIVLGTVPIGIAGVLLKKPIESTFRNVYVVAASLIVVALILWAVERVARRQRFLDSLTLRDALWVGCAQALAIVPGVSRSGATLAAALLIGLRRDEAARFSFLLSIPAVAAAGLFELRKAGRDMGQAGWLPILVATVVAGVVGYATIAWLIRFLKTRSLVPFAYYRIALGVVLLGLVFSGWLAPR